MHAAYCTWTSKMKDDDIDVNGLVGWSAMPFAQACIVRIGMDHRLASKEAAKRPNSRAHQN
eukprot:1364695-Amorphochlora_amoeboformis.AAC.2